MIVFDGTTLTTEDVKVLNPVGLIAGNSARTYSAWVKLEPDSFGTIIAS